MKTLLLALLALSGCFFVPKDSTTTRVMGRETVVTTLSIGTPEVRAEVRDATFSVAATTPRTCRHAVVEKIEITHGQSLDLEVGGIRDGYSALIALWAAPFTLSVSGLITGIAIAAHDDTITQDERMTGQRIEACPITAETPILLTLPSGAKAVLTTRANGTATYELPADEPDHGIVSLRARAKGSRRVHVAYYRTFAACDAKRREEFAKATTTNALEHAPRCGSMTTGADASRERAWEIAIASTIAAMNNECGAALGATAELAQLAPDLYESLMARPVVAACRDQVTLRQISQDTCLSARASALRTAQTIRSADARANALRRIPQCRVAG